MRTTVWATVLTVGVSGLVGCSSGDAPAAPRSLPPETASRWATAGVDPQQLMVMEATEAYGQARRVLRQMDEAPQLRLGDYPKDWAITDYVADPYLSETVRGAAQLKQRGFATRGGTDDVNPSLKSVTATGKRPTVVLNYCPDQVAELYDRKSGGVVTGKPPSGSAKPPYLLTETMTRVDGKWKLTHHDIDWTKTCKPS